MVVLLVCVGTLHSRHTCVTRRSFLSPHSHKKHQQKHTSRSFLLPHGGGNAAERLHHAAQRRAFSARGLGVNAPAREQEMIHMHIPFLVVRRILWKLNTYVSVVLW